MRSERSSANTQGNKCGMQEGKIDPVAGISMDTLVQAVHMSGRINRLDEYRVLVRFLILSVPVLEERIGTTCIRQCV